MRELLDIIAAHESLAREGKPSAIAMVVAIEGSSYRRPGARMLIAEDGRTWGGVSGGCLERDVVQRAIGVIATGLPITHRYETSDDEHLSSGASTGCGGVVTVLIHPYSDELIPAFATIAKQRQPMRIATVITASHEWRPLVGHALTSDSDVDCWPREIVDAVDRHRAGTVHVNDGNSHAALLVETIAPPQELVIFGGGPDVVPVVEFARGLGWHLTVVVAPPATQAAERLRAANRVIVTGAENPAADISFSLDAAVVVMTHNIARDRAILENLTTAPSYLGILGPRHRTERVLDGLSWSMDDDALYAPVGLDLGAETPEEIALSVIAEISAWRNGRTGGSLRDRVGAIHESASTPLIELHAGISR